MLAAGALSGCRSEPPANPEALLQARSLGLGYLQRDRFAEAEGEFKKIIALAPNDPFGYTNLGLTYMRMSRFEEAEAQLDRARALDPSNPDITLTLARLYAVTGRADEARRALEALSTAEPRNAVARFALTELDAQDSTRRTSAAYAARLGEVLALAPTNLAVRLLLVRALFDRGLTDSALVQLEEMQRAAPEPPAEARSVLADALQLLRDGKGAEARAPLKRFLHLMELTSPYQAQLKEVQWVEGAVPGRPILTFLPQTTIQLRGMGGVALISDSLRFTDATDEAGLPGGRGATKDEQEGARRASVVVATGDFNGDGTDDVVATARSGGDASPTPHLFRVERWRSADVTATSSLDIPAGAIDVAVGDYDNDGWLDLYVIGGDGRGYLAHNKGEGVFEDATRTSGTVVAEGATRALFVDVDHDGDLDLLLVGGDSDRVYRNNLDGTFSEEARALGLGAHSGGRDAAFGDFDGDGRIDLLVAYEGDGIVLYRNSSGAARRFADVTAASGLTGGPGARGVTVTDYDNDGLLDVLVLRAGGGPAELWRGAPDGAFTRDRRSDAALASLATAPDARATFVDVDNDGWLDLLVAGTRPARAGGRTLALLRNDGRGIFADASRLLPAASRAAAVVPFDVDGDGDQDLLLAVASGPSLLVNEGGNNRLSVQVTLNGLRNGSGKNNDFGIGARLELRAGTILQTRVVTGRVTHFGLGPHLKADVLRIEWPNGVPQTVYFPGTDQDVLELEALKGSCAFVYTWDGTRFRFVTDVMWRSALGMPVGIMAAAGAGGGRTLYAPAGASTEYLRIPGEALAARDGRYALQLTEELWETAYTDEVKLLAVDHPDSTDVFVDERFVPPGPTPLRLFEVAGGHPPRTAVDDRGRDVLPALLARDHDYVARFTPTRYQGVVAPHDLVLDLGDDAGRDDALLMLRGWVYPTDASINVAIAQQRALRVASPSLEVRDGSGRWVTAIAEIGFPSGKDKTVIVELGGIFRSSDRHVRIRTNMQVYWDQATVAHRVAATAMVTTLSPLAADLHARGYSRMYRAGGRNGPQWFDYDSVSTESPWRRIDGTFTRFGDVTTLLRDQDDMFVVMAPGDETTIAFDAASERAIPSGWRRDFILYTDGWIKDSDLNTAFGTSVGPLPFHGIRQYPYAAGESYPSDAAHRRFQQDFLTRPAGRR